MDSQKNIGLVFGVIILLWVGLGTYSLFNLNTIASEIESLYHHPYTVSNAARNVNNDLISMHRYMKDVALAEDEQQIRTATDLVNKHEQDALANFDVIFDRYLGESGDIQSVYIAFIDWKVIRDEVISLKTMKKDKEAADITRNKGAKHVTMLNRETQKLIDFADNKARTFLDNAIAKKEHAIEVISVLLVITVLASIYISYITVRNWNSTQQQLIDAERKYRTVADYTHNWEYWEAPDNNLVYVSPSCERISGYRPDEFLERPELISEIVIPEDQSTWDNHRHGLKEDANATPNNLRFRIKTNSGQIRWIGHICQAVYNEQGNYEGIRASNRDITHLLENQRLLDKQRDMLIHLDRKDTLGQLTGSIAHEINQPLTGILSSAQAGELLTGREELDKVQIGEVFRAIVSDTKRASRVIRNLRELFGKKKTEFTSLNVNKLVTQTLQVLHSELVHQCVSINTDLSKKTLYVNANKIQLQQLLINLMKNSLEAMQDAEKTDRWISVSTTLDRDDKVLLCVADNGPGIDPDQLETIFDPLVTTREDGMGMGLAICTSIIQAHSGRIWAENNAAGGAGLYVTLPLAD